MAGIDEAALLRTLRRIARVLAVSLGMGGCGISADPVDDYERRIHRVLDRPWQAPDVRERAGVPSRAALRVPVDQDKADWTEFARLHLCDMGDLVGARNSGLGRVARPALVLEADIRFVHAARRCAASGETWLQPFIERRVGALPRRFHNAVFASDAWQHLMTSAQTGQSARLADGLERLVHLNERIVQFAGRSDVAADLVEDGIGVLIERELDGLQQGAGINAIANRWVWIAGALERVSAALVEDWETVCDVPGEQAQRLRRVFEQRYVAIVQLELARVAQAGLRWRAALATLIRNAPQDARALRAWYRNLALDSDASHKRLLDASREHAAAWAQVFDGCGFELGATTWT